MQMSRDQFDLTWSKNGERQVVPRVLKKRKKTQGSPWYYYLGLVGHIGFTIAVPIAGGALLGGYLDRTWVSYPKATLTLLIVGTVLGLGGFILAIKDIIKESS